LNTNWRTSNGVPIRVRSSIRSFSATRPEHLQGPPKPLFVGIKRSSTTMKLIGALSLQLTTIHCWGSECCQKILSFYRTTYNILDAQVILHQISCWPLGHLCRLKSRLNLAELLTRMTQHYRLQLYRQLIPLSADSLKASGWFKQNTDVFYEEENIFQQVLSFCP
jgi:hypothetical protein